MTLEDIKKQDLLQTRTIAAACDGSPETLEYIFSCLRRFWQGDYGDIEAEDTALNNEDLAAGEGHILAHYPARYNLAADIYIESHFSETVPGIDSNNTMIMYCTER